MFINKEISSDPYSGRIFKADQRGIELRENTEIAASLNFGNYFSESRKAFGSLIFLNDIKIMAGRNVTLENVDKNICHIFLPLVGTISTGDYEFTTPEEIKFIPGDKNGIKVSNLYEHKEINFLHLGILSETGFRRPLTQKFSLSKLNEMVSLNPEDVNIQSRMYAGVFSGRKKSVYRVSQKGNGIFAFVINGAFEIEERLVEYRDGLSLWDIEEAGFESLSENAILLLIEIPLNN